MDAIEACVEYNAHGNGDGGSDNYDFTWGTDGEDSANGLSIYFPPDETHWAYDNYTNRSGTPANLRFVADTHWDEFMDEFFSDNLPPTQPTVSVTDPASTDDDLVAVASGSSDPEGGHVNYSFQWYKDDVEQAGQTSDTVSHTLTECGETWKCVVTPDDGSLNGPTGEDSVTINTPPTAPTVTIEPDEPGTDDPLVANASADDVDGDTVTYRYQWYKDDVAQAGETDDTLSHTLTARGETWKCVVTPTDGTDDGPTGEDSVAIGNTPPTAPTVVVTPNKPRTDDTLIATATGSTDPDGDSATCCYQWYKGDVLQPGQTKRNVKPEFTAKGETWKCVVTPTDGTDNGPTGEASKVILNTAPTLPTTITLNPTDPDSGQDVVSGGSGSTDPDPADTLIYEYQWWKSVGGGPFSSVGGCARATLKNVYTTRDEVWKVKVRAYDGSSRSGWAESAPITIRNAPPVLLWAGTTGFTSDGLEPATGSAATDFAFACKVKDPDNLPPATVQALVERLEDGGLWVNRATVDLTPGVTGNWWPTGKVCSATIRLAPGVYRHRFSVVDDRGAVGTGEPTANKDCPYVGGPPQLWLSGRPGRETDFVDPDSGTTSTSFTFSVLLTDGDNHGASPHRVEYQKRQPDDSWGPTTNFPLPPVSGTARTGLLYEGSRSLAAGTYRHRFVFADPDGAATGAATNWQAGPVVTSGLLAATAPAALMNVAAVTTREGAEILFSLSAPAAVDVRVLNIAGRPVRSVARAHSAAAGRNSVVWNRKADTGLAVPSGVYLVEVTVAGADGGRSRALATISLR